MREYLRDLRKERKLSQDDIAKRVGITQSFYSMIEAGERVECMTVEMAINFAKALGIDSVDFIKLEMEWERDNLKEGE